MATTSIAAVGVTFPDATVQASSAVFPSATAMVFVQTTAPTGWTKATTHDNKALRVVTGTASSGGSVAFTTAFASQAVSSTTGSTGSFTLTTNELPAHTHTMAMASNGLGAGGCANQRLSSNGGGGFTTSNTGGGLGHSHTFTGTAINLAVQYVDVIIATKN